MAGPMQDVVEEDAADLQFPMGTLNLLYHKESVLFAFI